MQRFTNLDRDEVLSVDLNSLPQDVVDVLKSGIKGEVDLELNFQPLPSIQLRPQQISAVFLNLLQNAIEGLSGKGQVSLSTCRVNSQLLATIQDNGTGLSAEELVNIFDPAFRVKSARVSTGNWSLFSSRQIVREHGGEIEIQSSPGKGTTVRVSLRCAFRPCRRPTLRCSSRHKRSGKTYTYNFKLPGSGSNYISPCRRKRSYIKRPRFAAERTTRPAKPVTPTVRSLPPRTGRRASPPAALSEPCMMAAAMTELARSLT